MLVIETPQPTSIPNFNDFGHVVKDGKRIENSNYSKNWYFLNMALCNKQTKEVLYTKFL